MKALILAAGMGRRISELTKDKPKGMIDFMGKTILQHQIDIFKSCGINEIIIVRGYLSDLINYQNIKYFDNNEYDSTNMIESFVLARNLFDDDFVVSYSDILFSKNVLKKIINNKSDIVVSVDKSWKNYWLERYGNLSSDLENLQIINNKIKKIGQLIYNADNINYRYVGLNKFTKQGLRQLLKTYDNKKLNNTKWNASGNSFKQGYFTDILQEIIDSNYPVDCNFIAGGWLEIDTLQDYKVACRLFESNKFKF